MDLLQRFEDGETLAEIQEFPAEAGAALAELAEGEMEAGRLETARALLEGLVVTNHRDALAWALLATTHRRLGQGLAARFCAEVAVHLAPGDPVARLARAESLLVFPEDREEALAALAGLAEVGGGVGERARALAAALRA